MAMGYFPYLSGERYGWQGKRVRKGGERRMNVEG
jgi:hypothetical protein